MISGASSVDRTSIAHLKPTRHRASLVTCCQALEITTQYNFLE